MTFHSSAIENLVKLFEDLVYTALKEKPELQKARLFELSRLGTQIIDLNIANPEEYFQLWLKV